MIVKLKNLALSVEQTQENQCGELEILDEDVLKCLGELVSKKVVQAFLVEWDGDWSLVAWWEADEWAWEMLANQAVFPVEVMQENPR